MTLFILFAGFACLEAEAQFFSLSPVSSAGYPIMSAEITLIDQYGNAYPNVNASEFTVTDNGNDVSPTCSLQCTEYTSIPPVNVVLAVDQSSSMDETTPDGMRRWDWVVEGTTAFINKVDMVNAPASRLAALSFGTFAYLRCPFTNDKQRIIDSIGNTPISGGTSFDQVLLDNNIGAISLLASRPDQNKRIIVMLTDGQPQREPPTEQIITRMLAAGISFYAITMATSMNQNLSLIASRTGGKTFVAKTIDDLKGIYSLIALDIQKLKHCNLSWQIPVPCDNSELSHSVSVKFARDGQTATAQYLLSDTTLMKYIKGSESYYFGNPQSSDYTEQIISVTPINGDMTADAGGINILPSTYFSIVDYDVDGDNKLPPYVFLKGVERKIKVRFTQKSPKAFRSALLTVNSQPCPITFLLTGGTPKPIITSPAPGAVYSLCDKLKISWTGVDSSTKVDLWYLVEGDTIPQGIASGVTGNSMLWSGAPENVKFKIIVSTESYYSISWFLEFGSKCKDGIRSIALAKDNSAIYTAGFLSAEKTGGSCDMQGIFQKIDSDGNVLFSKTVDGDKNRDSATCVAVDTSGNVYLTGICTTGIIMGSIRPNFADPNGNYVFINKYDAYGNLLISYFLAQETLNGVFSAVSPVITYDTISDGITLYGIYTGKYLPSFPAATARKFSIKFDNTLYPTNYGVNISTALPSPTLTQFDPYGNKYFGATFSGTAFVGNDSLKTDDPTDANFYVAKNGKVPALSDTLQKPIEVRQPTITLDYDRINFGNRLTDESVDTTLKAEIHNTDSLPVKIKDAYIAGSPAGVFTLITDLKGKTVNPGESLDLEIVFLPGTVGKFTGTFVLVQECPVEMQKIVQLEGSGRCNIKSAESYSFKTTAVNSTDSAKGLCLFTNLNPESLTVSYSVVSPGSDFTVEPPSGVVIVPPGGCLYATIVFNPKSEGSKSIVIAYTTNAGCNPDSTHIFGKAVSTAFSADDLPFGKHRVLTVSTGTLGLSNRSILPVKVTDLTFVAPPDKGAFSFDPVSLPFDVQAGQTITIPVKFVPQEEKFYESKILIKIADDTASYYSTLSGEGTLPKISMRYECGSPVPAGSGSTGVLFVSNPSTTADLYCESLSIASGAEYSWPAGAPADFKVPLGSELSFNVRFLPTSAGNKPVTFVAHCDAAKGPDENPRADSLLTVACEATGIGITSAVNFGGVLVCNKTADTVTIVNQNPVSSITVEKAVISGDPEISVTTELPRVIGPGSSLGIQTEFTPLLEKDYQALLNFVIDGKESSPVILTGTGKRIVLTFPYDTVKYYPNDNVTLAISALIPNLKTPPSAFSAVIEYPSRTFWPINESVSSEASGVTTTVNHLSSSGNLIVDFTGTIPGNLSGRLFDVTFKSYLADSMKNHLEITPVFNECPRAMTDRTTTDITGLCFGDGRLVEVSTDNFYLEASAANPITAPAPVAYSLPFSGTVKLEVFGSLGNLVYTIVSGEASSGRHTADFPFDALPPGVYYLRLTYGDRTALASRTVVK